MHNFLISYYWHHTHVPYVPIPSALGQGTLLVLQPPVPAGVGRGILRTLRETYPTTGRSS